MGRTRAALKWELRQEVTIPDGLIGRFLLDASFNSPPNRLDDCETFVEFKTLASLAMTPNTNARAQQVYLGNLIPKNAPMTSI